MSKKSPRGLGVDRWAGGLHGESTRRHAANRLVGHRREGLGPKDFYYEDLLLGLARTQELAGQKAEAIATKSYRK